MIHDMNKTLTRLFTVALLMMVSLGARADVKVLFGEKGTELQPAKDGTITLGQKELTGGTIIISQVEQKDGTTKVTFAVTPDKNYKLAENGLEVYAVIPPGISSTRGLEVSTTLTLKSEDFKDEASKRTYTTTIDSKLALWVKSADFKKKESGAKGTKKDYYYFIVNKSGKIVTYAKANQDNGLAANANQIPDAIKSVNATNWQFYNFDQIAGKDNITITLPTSKQMINCSSWGDFSLKENPTQMSTLSDCDGVYDSGVNYIFVFSDYLEGSIPDLKDETYYTLQYRGDSKSTYAYYDEANTRVANSGDATVTNAQNDPKYLWCFKGNLVGGVVDPYDIKIYNAYIGTGATNHFVSIADGVGEGPEHANNPLRPKNVINSPVVTSYYLAPSYQSGDYNITGNPGYNTGIRYSLWAEYQENGQAPVNYGKSGITIHNRFMRTGDRKQYSSIILTRVNYTYLIVDASGNTIVQATTEDNTLAVPDVIKSPLATYTYYGTQQDAIDGINALSGSTAGGTTTIYVRYTTSGSLDLSGGTSYYMVTNGNYLFASNTTTIGIESEITAMDNTRKWKINGNDAYQLTIQNADNSQYVSYNVSSGEAVPTLSGSGGKFFLHESSDGKYEVVAVTTADYASDYYTLGVASNTLKLYSNSNHPLGDGEVQTSIASQLPCAEPTISLDSTTGEVTFSSDTDGAIFYYTTDGTIPTVSPENLYSSLTITESTTIKVIAVKDGFNNSSVTAQTFNKVETPVIQKKGTKSIVINCTTTGVTIHYTVGSTAPDANSPTYSAPLSEGVSNKLVQVLAIKDGMVPATASNTIRFQCDKPTILRGNKKFTILCDYPSGVDIYYTIDDSTPSASKTKYNGEVSFDNYNFTVKAIAISSPDYDDSEVAEKEILENLDGEGTAESPYLIYSNYDFSQFAVKANETGGTSAYSRLMANIDAGDEITEPFSGTFEGGTDVNGNFYKISGLTHALFNTIDGGTVKNVILTKVGIQDGDNDGDAGAICNKALGATRIYNCGILPTATTRDDDGNITGFTGSSVSGSRYVGGLVGFLDGTSRVINCFSYANITEGSEKGGIVGYNNVASKQSSLTTMVMNCMFYGDIANGNTIAPIYGGTEINNVAGGLNNYNYYRYRSRYSKEKKITKYNRALAMEEKFITRFERYRLLLNSNKKLAAKYASVITSDPSTTIIVNPDDMAKWVLETADRSISGRDPYPYPILKAQRYYPSIINYDAENAPNNALVGRNKGGKLGKTLLVTIATSKSDDGGGQTWPTSASITTTSLNLQRTDKDFDRFNFNYDKVQLPYYNDVGTGNYTGHRVVTGWKITSITGGTTGTYTESDSWGGYNFADRHCTNKDLYTTSKRVFSQGAYWDVPEGVTAITIEPYWAIANYVSDETYDVVYNKSYQLQTFSPFGTQYSNDSDIDIYGDGNNQKVYTSIANALAGFDNSSKTVYDQAVVLVGNLHQYANPTNGDIPYTVMSIDMNHDNEPDYSFICSHNQRRAISPIRFDFLNIMGIAEAQLPKLTANTDLFRNVSIFNPKGWFEITNTCVVNFSQLEYDNSNASQNYAQKSAAPLILLGGTYEQFVSTQKAKLDFSSPKTKYIHVGGNAWFAKFGNGTHSDGDKFTPHVPISVTGGDYDEFYLSGTYQPNITNMQSDNAECYVSGGRFGDMAGASLEAIQGDVRWDIDYADITNFYGGGVNANNPITGNIRVDMVRSHVVQYCGGPKFGDMSPNKIVTTNATDCEFGTFFGAGYGGNSYNRVKYRDVGDGVPASYQDLYNTDRGKYFDGVNTNADNSHPAYGKKGKGVATDFGYEFFIWSTGQTGARFYVQFVSFSLARTNNVTSNLTDCTINKNFYGGGSLGKVNGTATSTLDGCTVKGNVFGGGYSATLPKIEVRNTPAFVAGKEPSKNINIGMFEEGEIAGTDDYEWKHVDSMPANGDPGMESTSAGNFVYTDEDLTTLGQVGTVNLTITNTKVDESVYGGGEESTVEGNTNVVFNSGTVGTGIEGLSEGETAGAKYGNVYGGGMGKYKEKRIVDEVEKEVELEADKAVKLGLVKGNTNVTINGGSILHNVYGGGAFGSVGNFTFADAKYNEDHPTATVPLGTIVGYTDGGTANVTITGGTIGTTGKENGMVFGSSRGNVDRPGAIHDRLAWVHDTHVVIGTSGHGTTLTTPLIKGSVYGSGENGHTYENTIIDVHSGTIGITDTSIDGGAAYAYRGNVYGGGCGTDTYTLDYRYDSNKDGVVDDNDDYAEAYNPLAGIVYGTTRVNIDGGHVVRNVYGAGAMGSVGTASVATSGKTTVTVSGGRIGYDGNSNNDGNIFGAARGDLAATGDNLAQVRETEVNINYATTPTADNEDKNVQLIAGSVFGGGEAGKVKGSVAVNMTGGLVLKDVYGGGALAHTQTSNWDATKNDNAGGWADADQKSALHTTTVSLTGGIIGDEVFGGGLGEAGTEQNPAGKPAYVWGDVLVELNKDVADDANGCVVGQVFGCNNINGTPKGDVKVHIYKTQRDGATRITNGGDVTNAKVKGTKLSNGDYKPSSFDVKAVYGGGNLAAYEPAEPTNNKTEVIIDGCERTSICQVYGGGNAASTPATNVTVNGTFEIGELFGGGNGKDPVIKDGVTKPNPGANVGYKDYSEYYEEDGVWKVRDKAAYDTKDERTAATDPETGIVYGTGKASVNIYGGTVHRVFGGSNTKGNVRQTAVTLLDENSGCDFCVDEAYGGGKSAEMDAEAKLLMACIPGLDAVYGGAEAADVHGNVTLNITNGTFDRVFGGNNLSGTISGAITVNIEEVGCRPIIIGELYGGGNQAGYSVYGYDSEGKPIESGSDALYDDPQVNVKSFTSIGKVFGGGYGSGATMVGNPTVSVNEVYGRYYNQDVSVVGEDAKTREDGYSIPSHAKGKMGAISEVFGGGNAAKVIGNTTVNIATAAEVYIVKEVTADATLPEGCYTRSGEGTTASPFVYTPASGTASATVTYYEKKDVLGADIRGNVYGGGNNAEVTGDTNVVIGKEAQ